MIAMVRTKNQCMPRVWAGSEAGPKGYPKEVYGQLGLALTYDPAARRVKAEARPESIVSEERVRGPSAPKGQGLLTADFSLDGAW